MFELFVGMHPPLLNFRKTVAVAFIMLQLAKVSIFILNGKRKTIKVIPPYSFSFILALLFTSATPVKISAEPSTVDVVIVATPMATENIADTMGCR